MTSTVYSLILVIFSVYFVGWEEKRCRLGHVACGILAPGPGIEFRAKAVKALSPNHWTTRELQYTP